MVNRAVNIKTIVLGRQRESIQVIPCQCEDSPQLARDISRFSPSFPAIHQTSATCGFFRAAKPLWGRSETSANRRRNALNTAKSQPLSAELGVKHSCSPARRVVSPAVGIHRESGRDQWYRCCLGAAGLPRQEKAACTQAKSSQRAGMRGKSTTLWENNRNRMEIQAPRGFLEEMYLFFVIEKGTVVNILFICQQTCLAAPCLLPSCDRLAVVKRGTLHN